MLQVEILAAILTLLCVWLTAKRNVWSWPVGIWAVCLYGLVFYKVNLYADFILQAIFALQGIIGFFVWYRNRESKKSLITKVEHLSNKDRFFTFAAMIGVYFVAAFTLNTYANSSLPFIDSLVSTFSLFANYLLIRRKIESWWIWIFVDVIYVGLFLYKDLYVSSALYIILLALSIKGYIDWNKRIKNISLSQEK